MTELTKEQSDLIERFLTAQNAVEEQLQAVLGVRRGESGYGELIREYQRRNPRWSDGEWKTFESTKHYCVVSYLANWTINVQTPGGAGTDPEHVNLRRASAGLPAVQIYALKGALPILGFENCKKNLLFRGVEACSMTLLKGEMPATQRLVFQKDAPITMSLRNKKSQSSSVYSTKL